MQIGFIGGGRMCASFSRYLQTCPIDIAGTLTKADLYLDFTQRKVNAKTLAPFLRTCDIVFLTVRDDAILPAAEDIAHSGVDFSGCVFCHMSGSLSSDALLPLSGSRGVFSLHTMTSLTGGYVDFSKVLCTLQGEGVGLPVINEFIKLARLTAVPIKKEDKLLYHAASCFCANFFLPLVDTAKQIYNRIGFSDADADALMLPLLAQVMENLRQNGTAKALTGPFSRGDCETIQKHIACLEERMPDFAELYRRMGRLTAAFAAENGILTQDKKQKIDEILS